jgi:hypothetical protein
VRAGDLHVAEARCRLRSSAGEEPAPGDEDTPDLDQSRFLRSAATATSKAGDRFWETPGRRLT